MTTYAVTPVRKLGVVILAVLLVLMPVGIVASVALGHMPPEPLQVAASLMFSLLPAALLVPALLRREVTLDDGVLTVKSAYHTRRRAVADLDLGAAEVVDLNERKELRPLIRMFGFSLVGFRAGHYWTRGRKRAFALLTSYDRVLAIPERSGTHILLSLERPERLLAALKDGVGARP